MTAFRLSRGAHYRYVSRIYALLNAGEWQVRLARISGNVPLCIRHGIDGDSVGFVDEESQCLYLDYRFDVLSTLVHECLHVIHPDMAENGIRDLEIAVMARLSPLQARRLHMLMETALI